jgi:membrane protein implicated in regulation of membrane protease activity
MAPEPGGTGGGPGPSSSDVDAEARTIAGAIALVFAGGMHLMIGGFVALAGRVAPGWAVAALAFVWIVLAVVIWRWHRRRPLPTLLVPFVGAGVLWGALRFGERVLGWGA